MKLTIEIEYGNAAMSGGADAARAIKAKLRDILETVASELSGGGKIMDDNGNTVGRWEVES